VKDQKRKIKVLRMITESGHRADSLRGQKMVLAGLALPRSLVALVSSL